MRLNLEDPEALAHMELAAALRTLQLDVQVVLALRDSGAVRARVLVQPPHFDIRLPLTAGWARVSASDFVVAQAESGRGPADVDLAALEQDRPWPDHRRDGAASARATSRRGAS